MRCLLATHYWHEFQVNGNTHANANPKSRNAVMSSMAMFLAIALRSTNLFDAITILETGYLLSNPSPSSISAPTTNAMLGHADFKGRNSCSIDRPDNSLVQGQFEP